MARSAVLAVGALVFATVGCGSEEPPYPASELVAGVDWDFDRRVERAPGSDNWALTAAADGVQYAAWGDGGGFGGSNSDGRVSLGVARIEGGHPDFTAVNVWGGVDAESEATFGGKSYGILAVGDRLWMWVTPGSGADGFQEARLAYSDDGARRWTQLDWALAGEERLVTPAFLQTDRQASRPADGHIYAYLIELQGAPRKLRVQRPGRIHLMRVAVDSIADRAAWRYFAGLGDDGSPSWHRERERSSPVFEDPAGVGWCLSVAYHAGLDRFILVTEHGRTFRGRLGFFEAPNPWGPWSTVAYHRSWGPDPLPSKWFYGNLAPAWSDGDRFVFVATGVGECDRWMSVPARFRRREAS